MKIYQLITLSVSITMMHLSSMGQSSDLKPYAGLSMTLGGGLTSIQTGLITNENDMVEVSCGGGFSLGISGAYPISKSFLLGAEFNYQATGLTPPVDNASGGFTHFNFIPSVKYGIPVGRRYNTIMIGAGPVLSSSNSLDIDAHKIEGGAHNIFYYKTSMGACLDADFVFQRHSKGLGAIVGLRYSYINYTLNKIKSNGESFSADNSIKDFLPEDVNSPDGSGVDVYLALIYSF